MFLPDLLGLRLIMALPGRAMLMDAWRELCLVEREVGNNGY